MASQILDSHESEEIAHSNVFIEERTERRDARPFFLQEEQKSLDNFIEQSRFIFKKTGEVFASRYEALSTELTQSRGGDVKRVLDRTTKQFEAYCLLKKKVDYKKECISNFANMMYEKNLLRAMLSAWKDQKNKLVKIKRLDDQAEKYNQHRILRAVLKSWNGIMMQENRIKIKNNVLRKTEVELTKITKEYEKIIEEMERTLSTKLIELKKEEDEHKLLHDKYEAMYSRKRVQGAASGPIPSVPSVQLPPAPTQTPPT